MKNLYFVLSLLLCFGITSCSNDSEDYKEQAQDSPQADYKPYISSQMQDILNMVDTCNTFDPIPINKLIPGVENLMVDSINQRTSLIKSTETDGRKVVRGNNRYSFLYVDVNTYIDATTAKNMGFNNGAGTYKVTCIAATKFLESDIPIESAFENRDIMGMNPDNITQRGYAIEKKLTKRYFLTTYLYTFQNIFNCYPMPVHGPMFLEEYLDSLEWYYFE